MSLHLFVLYCFTQPLSDYTPVYCLVLCATTHTASYNGGRAEPLESFDPVEDAEGRLKYLFFFFFNLALSKDVCSSWIPKQCFLRLCHNLVK